MSDSSPQVRDFRRIEDIYRQNKVFGLGNSEGCLAWRMFEVLLRKSLSQTLWKDVNDFIIVHKRDKEH